MQSATLCRLFICLTSLGVFLYLTIDRQNQITKLRFALPRIAQEIKELKEANMRLAYEIESFEHPLELMRLLRLAEYSHLKHPCHKEILTVQAGNPNTFCKQPVSQETALSSDLSFATLLAHFSLEKDE